MYDIRIKQIEDFLNHKYRNKLTRIEIRYQILAENKIDYEMKLIELDKFMIDNWQKEIEEFKMHENSEQQLVDKLNND